MTRAFGEIAEGLRRSTVRIECGGSERGAGSGVIWSAEGVIVTNAHVARSERPDVELWDGRRFSAGVTQRDPRRDIAVLRIPASGLPAAEFGGANRLRPGELVMAVGHPMGFMGALSTGVVHSIGPISGLGRQNWVRASVRLAPGNSGGPLADASGRVVGINTAIVHGLGVALPGETVSAFIRRGGRPALGVALRPVSGGLLVLDVTGGGAAAQASLWVGDILTGIDGRRLRDPDDLLDALEAGSETMQLEFVRGDPNRTRRTTVRLGARAAEAA